MLSMNIKTDFSQTYKNLSCGKNKTVSQLLQVKKYF